MGEQNPMSSSSHTVRRIKWCYIFIYCHSIWRHSGEEGWIYMYNDHLCLPDIMLLVFTWIFWCEITVQWKDYKLGCLRYTWVEVMVPSFKPWDLGEIQLAFRRLICQMELIIEALSWGSKPFHIWLGMEETLNKSAGSLPFLDPRGIFWRGRVLSR